MGLLFASQRFPEGTGEAKVTAKGGQGPVPPPLCSPAPEGDSCTLECSPLPGPS